ncbi:MAG: hypothetical protein JWM47_1945 [Acidimicrobiales bacterium]|nr:hypothetical protein [Acidimicrobiales bacterium]
MRVDVAPRRVNVMPGSPVVLTVSVFNTSNIISAQRIRVLGLDAAWVTIDQTEMSLFPDESAVVNLTVSLPAGIPAGVRRVTIQVREVTPPMATESIDVILVVAARQDLRLALSPTSTSAGKRAEVSLTVTNLGNDRLDLGLDGDDEEERMTFAFEPPILTLAPGEAATSRVRLKGRRPWVGAPKVRPFQLHAIEGDTAVTTQGAFIQKPRLTRGLLSLLGLLAALTMFAAVLTYTLGRVVDTSTDTRELLLQAIKAGQESTAGETGSISGQVTLQTETETVGVGGVTVQAYAADDVSKPVIGTATDNTGTYAFTGLEAGSFKLEFHGVGFATVWYPVAVSGDVAEPITVEAGKGTDGIDVRLGGLPSQASGRVIAAEPSDAAGATVTLQIPGGDVTGDGAEPADESAGEAAAGAIVATVAADAAGGFVFDDIPSPAVYDLVVTKAGYAVAHQALDLNAGEVRTGIEVNLRKGDGLISGVVRTTAGPLAGATVTASDGRSTFTTRSLADGRPGAFELPSVATPATYSLSVSAPGYATATLTVGLAATGSATGLNVLLTEGSGSISGIVRRGDIEGAPPIGGVTVTATNGNVSLTTVSVSIGEAGTFQIDGLAVPNTFTVTFSRPDLVVDIRSVALDPLTEAGSVVTGLDVSMRSATASLSGRLTRAPAQVVTATSTPCLAEDGEPSPEEVSASGPAGAGVGEVEITLTSGPRTYRTVSVSGPAAADAGTYLLDGLRPGTYAATFAGADAATFETGLTLKAGQAATLDRGLRLRTSSVTGAVYRLGAENKPYCSAAESGAVVSLYLESDYPGAPVATTETDGTGHYTFPSVEGGRRYLIEVTADYPGAPPDPKGTSGPFSLPSGVEYHAANAFLPRAAT